MLSALVEPAAATGRPRTAIARDGSIRGPLKVVTPDRGRRRRRRLRPARSMFILLPAIPSPVHSHHGPLANIRFYPALIHLARLLDYDDMCVVAGGCFSLDRTARPPPDFGAAADGRTDGQTDGQTVGNDGGR